ncbi:MAG: DUF3037 domain-containing protein [Marivirga sp.]|nr:DUF3037 domain-containing protein [Marivirga sp.]
MQENHVFEYAVIRVVPRVEREEFLNVGVILLCARKNFLRCRIELHSERLKLLCTQVEMDELKEHIRSFERICAGGADGGTIGLLSLPERFRWLTASRSTVLQTSKVHPGLCIDPQEKLDQLVAELVTS